MLAEMLGHLGYLSVICNDPRDAPALLTSNPERFDAAIVDEIMPALRGTELTVHLLRIRQEIPVIFLTGTAVWQPWTRSGEAAYGQHSSSPCSRVNSCWL